MAPTQLAFDVTDLLDYLRDARTPTGIQRVQMGLLGAILEHPAPPAPVVLVAYDPSAWRWWHVDAAAFRAALDLSRIGAEAADPAWRAATTALCATDPRPDAPSSPGRDAGQPRQRLGGGGLLPRPAHAPPPRAAPLRRLRA
jgi:hypothetical protein